jgi:hypothetical protein
MRRKSENPFDTVRKLRALQHQATDKLEKIRQKSAAKPVKKQVSPALKKRIKTKPRLVLRKKLVARPRHKLVLKRKPAAGSKISRLIKRKTVVKKRTKTTAENRPVLRHFFR